MQRIVLATLSLVLALGCSSNAYAHPGHRHAAEARGRPLYQVTLIRPDGSTLPTYQLAGRAYIMGDVGERYLVRVHNMTGRRVEAVISVDGLDVIDGRTASPQKRGYLIEPYAWVDVDGFRVSQAQVAAFRFSSVGASYAGRKGQARNVGVVGVAMFAERDRPVVVTPPPYRVPADPEPYPYPRDYESDDGASRSRSHGPSADKAAPSSPPSGEAEGGSDSGYGSGSARGGARAEEAPSPPATVAPPQHRPGLGTEFGEYRHSQVTFVSFERRHPTRPDAVLELRYNDREGLTALGIPVPPPPQPYHDETWTRETANPFPGYAQPPEY